MSEPLTDVVDWETTDCWLFGEAWTGAHIARHARQLCDVIDPRWSGTDAEWRTIESMAPPSTCCPSSAAHSGSKQKSSTWAMERRGKSQPSSTGFPVPWR